MDGGRRSLKEKARRRKKSDFGGGEMKIRWLGHASFLIETSGVRLITDPFDNIGIDFPSVEADVVTTSHEHFDHNATSKVKGEFEVIRGTEKKSVKGIVISGIPTYHDEQRGAQRGDNTIFIIEAEGLRVAHMGDIGHLLDDETSSQLKGVDILMVPVGGTYTVDAAGAANIVETVSPRIVIPMHFKIGGLTLPISDERPFVERFDRVERVKELEVTKDTLPETTTVFVLEPQI